MKQLKKFATSLFLKIFIFTLAMMWGLSANGYEIIAVPAGIEGLFGNYFTEALSVLIAWTIANGVSEQISQ